MQYIKYFSVILLCFISPLFSTYKASAVSSTIVISQVQTGGAGTGTAGQEFIELYNNNAVDVNITGWCVVYNTATSNAQSTVYCFTNADGARIWLKPKSYATLVSSDYKVATGVSGDGTFVYNGGLSSTGGKVRVLDESGSEVDRLAWGTVPNEAATAAPAGGKVLQRSGVGVLLDTDSPTDFMVASAFHHGSGIYEALPDFCVNIPGAQSVVPAGMILNVLGECTVQAPVDVCPNISELQTAVPLGYLHDTSGNCQPDNCQNITGLQINVPEYYDRDAAGSCYEHDECPNMSGAQFTVPQGRIKNGDGICQLDLIPLQISEIVPNVAGSDTGKEYVELYNPSSQTVKLSSYVLRTGVNLDKEYGFGASDEIGPKEYKIFSDTSLGFTLGNSTGRVVLGSIEGMIYSDTGVYMAAGDDMAWSYMDGVWQYTDNLTPNSINLPSAIEAGSSSDSVDTVSAACPTGKYRNPLTNRCRNIESDAVVLASCDADQYRSPDTGRCRKLATAATITPCKDGQYRSEETNRCRNISASDSNLAPCKEGQERNQETNRCRNVAAKVVPAAAYAIEPVKDSTKAFIGWWALGGVGAIAVAYAGWEWRRDIAAWIRNVLPRGK